ncbi:hypothetical protein AVEN_173495-1 [Araneus ventricosus]|uniref:Uncharacterized protein n=1 Tax=Araneus ventricosus TaxID=182803 RepID=A0A4Y2TBN4_ARAVE|nr:hypothetical protein AVEN_173495-1 [Araneus ventricosus]
MYSSIRCCIFHKRDSALTLVQRLHYTQSVYGPEKPDSFNNSVVELSFQQCVVASSTSKVPEPRLVQRLHTVRLLSRIPRYKSLWNLERSLKKRKEKDY